jgi:hypothetical protein
LFEILRDLNSELFDVGNKIVIFGFIEEFEEEGSERGD